MSLAAISFDPTNSCTACGKCCFVWSVTETSHQAVARCRSLSIDFEGDGTHGDARRLSELPEVDF